MGGTARNVAFLFIIVFIIGTFIGSVLPDFGNVLAKVTGNEPHFINGVFLAVGIIGVMLALYIGYRKCR